MKIYTTGWNGTVGTELKKRGVGVLDFDITKPNQTKDAINTVLPDVLIHCAALTDVAYCEEHPDEAVMVNIRGVNNIVDVFTGTLIYISSDHVFSGKKWFNFGAYNEKHKPDPINVYGMTKYGGETISRAGRCKPIIVRTSKLFSHYDIRNGIYEIETGYKREYTNLIRRSFLYVPHFVDGLMSLVEMSDNLKHGEIVHIAGREVMSYYGFWHLASQIFGFDSHLVKARNHEIEEAPRPFRGGLDVRKADKLGIPLYTAQEGLEAIRDG